MQYFDIFNGDADGLIARHQYRLAFPVPAAQLTLITGVKRDIALVARAIAPIRAQADVGNTDAGNTFNALSIAIFDISYDQNAIAIEQLLARGSMLRYFDHHRASKLQSHPNLDAHIDTVPDVCTSLLVDRFLEGAYRDWTIAALFGDNLIDVATALAKEKKLSAADTQMLRDLGECLNYNAYGESEADLYFRPAELAARLAPHKSPFDFISADAALATLQNGFADDMQRAMAIAPHHISAKCALYLLPDTAWARRVSGVFANRVAEAAPARAHGVLTKNSNDNFTVSIRAPIAKNSGADIVAIAFAGGGGRAGAAGINNLVKNDIAKLIAKMDEVFA